MAITWGIYFGIAVVCTFLFGKCIMDKGSNVILNINEEFEIDSNRWEAFVLRILFMIVLACHIPFIFFSGKEALLIIIDEIDRRSISQTLEHRV